MRLDAAVKKPYGAPLVMAAVAAAYFVAAKFGLMLANTTQQVTAVWPPSGIALVALLLLGRQVWPGVFLGAWLVNATLELSWMTAAGIALGNTLGSLIGAILLHRLVKFDNAFTRLRDVFGLLLGGALLPMLLTASNGVANLALAGIIPWSAYFSVWWVWWVGDSMGVLLFTPFLLAWIAQPRITWRGWRLVEFCALFLGLVAASHFVFTGSAGYQIQYVVFPFIIWSALRFGQRETSAAVLLLCGYAIWGAVDNLGSFVLENMDQSLIFLEIFMAVAATTSLVLGAVIGERKQAEMQLLRAGAEMEERVRERTADLMRAYASLSLSELRFRTLMENMQVGLVVQDNKAEILLFNSRALALLGLSANQLLGKTSFDSNWRVIHEDGSPFPAVDHPLPQAIATCVPVRNVVMGVYRPSTQEWVWLLVDAEPQLSDDGTVREVICTFSEITERKQAQEVQQALLQEKEALLKEVHHRVKNNLQVITSLLRLESGSSGHPDIKAVLGDMQGRIRAMAMLHETLYRNGTFATVDLGSYLKQLASQSFRALMAGAESVKLRLDLNSVTISMDQATPCGIIVNELISNCLKHGFPGGRSGEVRIALKPLEGGQCCLSVSDTGVGLPADFTAQRSSSLGLQLVASLAAQLGGALEIEHGVESGVTIAVTFNVDVTKVMVVDSH